MKQTKKAHVLAPLVLSLAVPLVAVQTTGCKKDEPPPPLPSAAPVAAPVPTAPVELVPEVPVAPSASASASAKPVTGGGSAGSLKKCCSALTQNAQSAPEPNKTYMLQAAAVCNGAAAAGQASGQAFGMITAALRGAGMPTACK